MNSFPENISIYSYLQTEIKNHFRVGIMKSMSYEFVSREYNTFPETTVSGNEMETFPRGNNGINNLQIRFHGNVSGFPQAMSLKIKRFHVSGNHPPTGGGGGSETPHTPRSARGRKAGKKA